jgi:hypothetical protein
MTAYSVLHTLMSQLRRKSAFRTWCIWMYCSQNVFFESEQHGKTGSSFAPDFRSNQSALFQRSPRFGANIMNFDPIRKTGRSVIAQRRCLKSPKETNRFLVAPARSTKIAATAKNSMSPRGVKTGHPASGSKPKSGVVVTYWSSIVG